MNDPTISRHLEETGAYSDLKTPVLITSGESLTPFFINAEKLCRDPGINGYLKKHGDDPDMIIHHALKLMEKTPEYREDIEIISYHVSNLLKGKADPAISGGQRRDWIFSGPVAYMLNLPHIDLYKQETGSDPADDRVAVILPNGRTDRDGTAYDAINVSDLNTTGSSLYRKDKKTGRDLGWIPMLRDKGHSIDDAVTVVTRLQGGEETLESVDVRPHYFVAIDKEFLEAHSTQPEVAISYVQDATRWTQDLLLNQGTDILVPYFEAGTKNFDRGKKFMYNYRDFMLESGLFDELDKKVKDAYGTDIRGLLE